MVRLTAEKSLSDWAELQAEMQRMRLATLANSGNSLSFSFVIIFKGHSRSEVLL